MTEKAKSPAKEQKETYTIEEPKFEKQELLKHSRELFGVKPEVLVGAFHHAPNSSLTKSEAQKLIHEFLKKEVV